MWPFRKKVRKDFFNIDHPAFTGSVEEAFVKGGTRFYRFKSETMLPYGRYQLIQSFLLEYDIRMTYKLFKDFIAAIEGQMDGSRGNINIGKAFELIQKMKARAELAFSSEQAYRLASVIYFDDTEDLHSYDMEHNNKKIALWREAGDLSFFYMTPLDELLGLKNFSEQDLINFISRSEEILKDLTLDTP